MYTRLLLLVFLTLLISTKVSFSRQNQSNGYFIQQIKGLQLYYEKYQFIGREGGLPKIPKLKNNIKYGDSSFQLIPFKSFLYKTGDIIYTDASPYFNEGLKNGISSYQQRNGLEATGVINKELIHSMNQSIDVVLKKIKINIQRYEKLAALHDGFFILINIPEYKLYLLENNIKKYEYKVIVGKPVTPTKELTSQIEEIILSPYWYVPTSIYLNEILPAIKINHHYLSAHQMEYFGKTVRQLPGEQNSLGVIKFNFKNPFSIYLHDTPAKNLFNYSERAFSHGCIRLEHPLNLALYLLQNNKEWDKNLIEKAIIKKKETVIKMNTPVKLFVVYLTSWVDENNQLHFTKDLYRKD